MAHQVTAPNPGELNGISAKTNDIHHGKLYTGYVNKRNEIEEAQKAAENAIGLAKQSGDDYAETEALLKKIGKMKTAEKH